MFHLGKLIIQSVACKTCNYILSTMRLFESQTFENKKFIFLDPRTLKTQVRPAMFSQMPTELSEQIYSVFHIEQCC